MRRASACLLVYGLRLECVKSTYSITSVHLALRTSSGLWSSAVQVVAALELLYNIDYVGIVRIECYSGLATGWRDNTVSG